MVENKNFYKELRRQLLGGYGKSDCEIDQTTSWSDGLDEASRFSPYLRRPVRRTDSVDDIERYYRYFSLARKNQGNQFTWKYYCNILWADLLNSDVREAFKKLSIQPSCAPSTSKGSNVPPVLTSVFSTKKTSEKRARVKRSFLDVDNALSSEDVRFLAPSKSVAKLSIQPSCAPSTSKGSNVPPVLTSVFSTKKTSEKRARVKRSFLDVDNALSSEDVRFLAPSKSVAKFSNQPPATPIQSDVPMRRTVGRVSSLRGFFENHRSKKRSFVDIEADVESLSSSDDVKFQTPSKNVLKKMCTEIRTLAQKTCKTVEKITTPTKYCLSCGDVIYSTTVHKKCSKQRTGKSDCKKTFTPSMLRSANSCKNQHVTFESPSITPVYVVDPRTKKFQRKPLFKP